MKKISTADIIAALGRTMGKIYLAAEQLHCDPTTIYHRAKKSPTIKKAIKMARGKALDTAECALARAVVNGEAWAVCFTLKTLGKDRGYVERSEVTGANGKELPVIGIRFGAAHERNGVLTNGAANGVH